VTIPAGTQIPVFEDVTHKYKARDELAKFKEGKE
jgi:hypothetical protein